MSCRLILLMFAVHVSSLCPQADASGQRLSRKHLPVLRSSRIIREGRTIHPHQQGISTEFLLGGAVQFGRGNVIRCMGRGQTSCTFCFSTALAMLLPQQPPEHLSKRSVFDLPSTFLREQGGKTDLDPHFLCHAVCFNHSIILSTDRIP